METVIDTTTAEFVEAVRLWTGWGKGPMPSKDDMRVVERFGIAMATRILRTIKALESDFYESDANLRAVDMLEMQALSMSDFSARHPEVPLEVVKLYAWCYTFDNR